jgi:hypothetical protein
MELAGFVLTTIGDQITTTTLAFLCHLAFLRESVDDTRTMAADISGDLIAKISQSDDTR